MHLLRTSLILALLSVSGCASVLAPVFKPSVEQDAAALRGGQYALDPAHAALLFRIDHLGFSEFVGRFEVFEASLDFDETRPSDAKVEALIDMTSLDIANDDFAETLMGPGWFDAGAFPNARFESTAITVTGDTTGEMAGNLTLNGVTKQVMLDVVFNGGGRDRLRGAYVVGFSAKGRISRAAFGVDRFSGIIADAVEIEIQAEFLRR